MLASSQSFDYDLDLVLPFAQTLIPGLARSDGMRCIGLRKQGELVEMSFKVFGLAVDCKGTVVWRTQSTVTHPKGVGIKFSLETRPQKRVLRQINGRLRKIASLYRRSRYLMNQDEFLKRLDELERRGA